MLSGKNCFILAIAVSLMLSASFFVLYLESLMLCAKFLGGFQTFKLYADTNS